ncbi:MAG: energy transducer TonB [Terracidiphilus sp.]
MRALLTIALFVVSSASFSGGQQDSSSASSPTSDVQPARVKVYADGPGVTAPELLPFPPPPHPAEECGKKIHGTVVLSVIVDAAGQPRNIMFIRPLGTDLDKFALQVAAADHFRPGTRDGVPVAVGQSLDVNMQACVEKIKNEAGEMTNVLQLRSKPVQTLGPLPQPPEEVAYKSGASIGRDSDDVAVPRVRTGSGATAPVPLNTPEAHFSEEAKRANYQGTCLLSLVVDSHGMPQNVRVVRKLGMGLDEKAVEAVNKYRFKPAMKDGQPVAAITAVAVEFHLY